MNRILRISRIIVSVAAFAILSAGLLSGSLALPYVCGWLERTQIVPAVMGMSLVTFVGWLLVTLIFGRVYCSSVCPLGTLQDIASRAVRMGRRGRRRVYRYSPPNTAMRYLMLGAMVASIMGGFLLVAEVLDPYSAYSRICAGFFNPVIKAVASALESLGVQNPAAREIVGVSVTASIIATFLFAVTVVVAAYSGRTICNTICPVGTTLGVVSRYSIFQIDIDTDKCIQCRRCEYVCKSRCIDLTDHVVDGSRCVDCFNCINVCPNDAIHYTTTRKRLSIPMMQSIGGKVETAPEAGMTGAVADGCNECETTDKTEIKQ